MLENDESSPERKWKVNVYNLKTGVLKGSQKYKWTMPGDPPYVNGYGGTSFRKDKLYILQGNKIAELLLTSTSHGPAPLRTFQRPYSEKWYGLAHRKDSSTKTETRELLPASSWLMVKRCSGMVMPRLHDNVYRQRDVSSAT